MSHTKTGHNRPIEEGAIKLIRKIYDGLIVQQQYAENAFVGKNKTIRDNNALMSAAQVGKTLKELESWNEVIKAKENGVDIHAAPIKTHKLDIAGSAEHQFGQYIIGKEDYEKR